MMKVILLLVIYNALHFNTTGGNNTAVGFRSLYSNTEGFQNTAIGMDALYYNTKGNWNTAIGTGALYYNTEGQQNTAIGDGTLLNNTTGSENTAIGSSALYLNTTGFDNTATGTLALYNNTTGHDNTANGDRTLQENTTGSLNTAIGHHSLLLNTTGSDNTAIGHDALWYNTTGTLNTAIGYQALYSNTTGSLNTANGYLTLYSNTEGHNNTANGGYALYYNTTQEYNTAVGYSAGDHYTFSGGTFLGSFAYPNNSGYTNVMGLGYDTRPTASDQVRIGNSSVTSIGGAVNWGIISDGRYKTSIQENVAGLDFILKLRPITYQLDMNRLSADLKESQIRDEKGNINNVSSDIDIKARNEKSQIVYTGFVAQEVEKAAKELGYDFSGVDAPKNENDFYGLRYAEFVVPLVKAVQEQQKIIEGLTRRIEDLERK